MNSPVLNGVSPIDTNIENSNLQKNNNIQELTHRNNNNNNNFDD
jgi:hypothetical protein